MKTEADFRRAVTDAVMFAGGHMSNIESHKTSAGIPDCNYFLRGVDVWLELKVVNAQGQVKMRPPQKRWHVDRHDKGGVSWVLVLDPCSGYLGLVQGQVAAALPLAVAKWSVRWFEYPSDVIPQLIEKLAEHTKYEQDKSHQQRTGSGGQQSNEARGAGSALREGGQGVVGHHWLHDKP